MCTSPLPACNDRLTRLDIIRFIYATLISSRGDLPCFALPCPVEHCLRTCAWIYLIARDRITRPKVQYSLGATRINSPAGVSLIARACVFSISRSGCS